MKGMRKKERGRYAEVVSTKVGEEEGTMKRRERRWNS
jgi:hypothetical protein